MSRKQGWGDRACALVQVWTHCKAAKDVCSSSHADADHAVNPAEKPTVTDGQEMNIHFMHIIIDQLSTEGTYLS